MVGLSRNAMSMHCFLESVTVFPCMGASAGAASVVSAAAAAVICGVSPGAGSVAAVCAFAAKTDAAEIRTA